MPVKTVLSNRIESLAAALGESLRLPRKDLFDPQWILVNSSGMESWLRHTLTENLEICGNFQFPFLSYFVDLLISRHSDFGPTHVKEDPFSRQNMVWRIFRIINEVHEEYQKGDLESGRFWQPVLSYISASSQQFLALYQLSGRLASLFDQYQLFSGRYALVLGG